jgi:hypothetical protein
MLPRAMNLRKLVPLAFPLLAPALALYACGGENSNLPPGPPAPEPAPTVSASAAPTDSAAASASASASAAPAPPPPVLASASAAADPPPPLPTVKIVSPAKDQVIPSAKAADAEVKLDIKNWKIAQGDAHVHLILDANPYKPIYDPTTVVKLSELANGQAIADGQHILVAFPSRATHESVKTPGALAIVPFWVGKKGTDKPQDTTKPMLIYSRPKGDYKGDMASRVLVDFQLANDKLAPDKDKVHVTVTGPGIDTALTADATQFGPPFTLTNLQPGSYTVKLDLVGPDGKNLPGSWNSTSRTFTVSQ